MSSLRGRLTVVLVALAVVFVGTGVAASWAFRRLDATQDRLVEEVQRGRVAAKDLEVALLDQETAIRGYALAGDPAFLEPGVAGLEGEEAASAAVRDVLGDDPEVAAALDRVAADAQAWRDDVAIPAARLVGDGDLAAANARLEIGKGEFDTVRGGLIALNDLLSVERDEAVADSEAAINVLRTVAAITGALILAAGVAVAIALRRSVLRPLDRLGADAKQVTDGDFDHRIEAVGPDEVRELAEMVELMRLRITLELDEVQRAREQLEVRSEELQRSNRDLEQFAYVASHDLQEPLRKVSGFCQLLQRRYAGTLDERADEYIHYAVDGAQRMQDLISDLLSFSRVGRTTERFELVPLGDVVDTAWAQTSVPDGGRLERIGDLPAIAGDRALLTALFANLFSNSVKFAGDEPPCIELTTTRDGDHWHLSVQDNGIGIDPEFADKIFVIFQRLHTRDTYEGTGIGLALGKRIVEFHGGSIALGASTSGARFEITFPVVVDPDAVGPPPEALIPYRPEGMLR